MQEEEIAALYTNGYFQGEEYSDYAGDKTTIQKNFRRRLDRLLRYVQAPETKSLYEIGAAHGFFLDVARHRFARVEGTDISEAAAQFARSEVGVPVQSGDFLQMPVEHRIDVACLWDTIEHLQYPDLYVAKLSSRMKPGGVIAITTGDIGSTVARLRGKRWRQIHPPTHLHYFSRKTLADLLRRHGFQVRYSGYDGFYRNLDSMAAILLKVRRNRADVYNLVKRLGILRFDLYLNLRDIMYVIAAKSDS